MFGRRRRPVLGTAVVIGASRAAARHEVQKQSTSQSQYEDDVAREAERRRQEEAEQEERTQRAVEQALKKAGLHHDGVSQENITPLVLSPAMSAQQGTQCRRLPHRRRATPALAAAGFSTSLLLVPVHQARHRRTAPSPRGSGYRSYGAGVAVANGCQPTILSRLWERVSG
ncbi:hypothetical protein B0T22DRAFT_512779 [Podospora appendiculata]|uniref:Uncharacterized protein n=1 Tax=Podospora appendiculata TaxID=314037 RepID=A0AAE1CD00_9PEZI|nr:hypothetical protein B0T22DRAFT_512779 [Podospora appendiculata]